MTGWTTLRASRVDSARLVEGQGPSATIECPAGQPRVDVDAIGAKIWRELDGNRGLASIAESIAGELNLDVPAVGDHLVRFVLSLEDKGLLTLLRPQTEPADHNPVIAGPPVTIDFIMNVFPMEVDPNGRPTSLDLLRSVNPEGTPEHDAWERIVSSMRRSVGPERTVWGVKLDEHGLSWELYFCIHPRPPTPDIHGYYDEIMRGFSPIGTWTAPRCLPSTTGMVSFEFTIDDAGEISGPADVDVYQKSEPSQHVWLNYRLASTDRVLRNSYQTHDLPEDEAGLIEWFRHSRFATPEHPSGGSDHWLEYIGGLRSCIGTWCARKPASDGIYLRRTHPEDLARFTRTFGYPDHLCDWIDAHVEALEHLRFELSFDFTVHQDEVTVHKTGFYGYF